MTCINSLPYNTMLLIKKFRISPVLGITVRGQVQNFLNSEQSLLLFMTFRHKAFIQIMKFVRDYLFECLHYSQDLNFLINDNFIN